MSIILTCGHTVDTVTAGQPVMIKVVDRYGDKAVSYRTVCDACEDLYRQQGVILDAEDRALKWLNDA